MRGAMGQMIMFPAWLGKHSTTMKNNRLLQELCSHMHLKWVTGDCYPHNSYASTVLAMALCLPVCQPKSEFLSKWLNVSCQFLSQMLFSTYPFTMLYRNLGTFKTKGTFLWNFVTAGWQVTPCDLMWHVNSRCGEASCRLLYTVTLLYFSQLMDQELMTPVGCFHWAGPFITPSIRPSTFVYNTMGMTQHIVWVHLQQLDTTFWRPAVICSISVGLMVWDPC